MLTTMKFIATDAFLAQQPPIGPSGPLAPPGAEKLTTVASWVMWAAVLALVVAAIIAGIMLAYQRNQGMGGGEGERKLAYVVIGAIVTATAVSLVNTLVL